MATLKVNYGAWVLIGDGKKALFLHNDGDHEILNLRRLDVEQQQDASAGNTDAQPLEADRFAAHVADRINASAQENGFRELVIVAPPKWLAEIRKDLTPDAHKRVVCEIPKDYTHHPIPEIEKLLAAHAM
jgi:protein required for attachment to host cells